MSSLSPRLFGLPLLVAALVSCAAPGNAPTPAASAPAPVTAAPSITWDAAGTHVGQTITVTGPVVGTHVTTDASHVTLNVGKDFPDRARFTVYFSAVNGAPAPDKVYLGKTISVTGEIVLYNEVPEIKIEAKDIRILK